MDKGFTIPKECKIDGVVAHENTRYAIAGVKLDAEGKRLLATDGRIAVELPVPDMKDETTAVLPGETFKAFRKGGKHMTRRIHCDGEYVTVNGGTGKEKFRVDTRNTFPDSDAVMKSAFEGGDRVRLCLNAEYLKRIADAFGGNSVMLYIKVPKNGGRVLAAVGVKPGGKEPPVPNARGAIMPIGP